MTVIQVIQQMVHFQANINTVVVSYDSTEGPAAELRDLLSAASEANGGQQRAKRKVGDEPPYV